MLPLLIVVGGATASGKTALAIAVARHFGTDIVSADSRQFYREMRIGNARPGPAELAAAPHHFIADRSIVRPLSAGTYAEEAGVRLEAIFAARPVAVLCGGSGLYLRAVCEGLDEFPPVSADADARVRELHATGGLPALQAELARLDPGYYARVDRNNGRRLERALRVCYTSGRAYSSFLGQQPARSFACLYLQPAVARPDLYARIDSRVDRMLIEGLEAEARALIAFQELPVMQTVGYQEWWPHFAGAYDRERAVGLIKRNSRRYAKRQATWFREYAAVKDLREVLSLIPAAYL